MQPSSTPIFTKGNFLDQAGNRNTGLDLLRLVAVLLVLVRHLNFIEPDDTLLLTLHRGGWVGVDLFFVLSGFLVSGLLFREFKDHGRVDVVRFLIRRGFKIYPPFWLFLFTTIFGYAVINKDINSRSLFGELAFLQNYTSSLWNHTWSLAVEEHFYFFLAAFVFAITKLGKNRIGAVVPLFFFVASTALLLRFHAWDSHPQFNSKHHLFPTHLRIDSLLLGTFVAYLFHRHNLREKVSRVPSSVFIAVGMILLLPAFVFEMENHQWITTFGFSGFALGSAMLVIAAVRIKSAPNFVVSSAATLGASSYCIYLWHMPVNQFVQWVMIKANIESFLLYSSVYVGASLLIGHILNRLIEIPVLRVRDRMFPR